MSKRTLGLIIFLILITGVLLFIALSPKIQSVPSPKVILPVITATKAPQPVGHTSLSLLPNPLVVSSQSTSVDIVVDSNGDKLTAIQAEISFDPKALTPTSISQGDFLINSIELIKRIDVENGRISYALALAPNSEPKAGKGTVATINFTVNPQFKDQQTTLTFLPKSLATAERVYESVLVKSEGTTVVINSQASTTP